MKNKIHRVLELLKYIFGMHKEKYLLIDTPEHGNLGDHAIIIAMQQFVGKNRVLELTANRINNIEWLYAIFTRKDVHVLIPGGGFLGSLWPNEEMRVQRIIKAFKYNKITIFPQTIFYEDSEQSLLLQNKAKEIYEEHNDMQVFVRDKQSFDFLSKHFDGVNCSLVPDIVLTLKPCICGERNNIALCLRKDKEKIVTEEQKKLIEDYIKDKYPNETVEEIDTVEPDFIKSSDREKAVYNKLLQFSSLRLIVTDRLHGMIFAAITNTPCIAIGNISGKVKGVYEWIKNNSFVKYAESIEEVESLLSYLDINKKYCLNNEDIDKQFTSLNDRITER